MATSGRISGGGRTPDPAFNLPDHPVSGRKSISGPTHKNRVVADTDFEARSGYRGG